jgi:hypothetical protein
MSLKYKIILADVLPEKFVLEKAAKPTGIAS